MEPAVVGRDKRGVKLAERICIDCGAVKLIRWYRLRDNPKLLCKSCGTRRQFRTHGMTQSPTYSSWLNMRTRCYDKRAVNYERYGGRGIRVCDRWLNSFDDFLADMGLRPSGMTLDRKDSTRDYFPDNCQWSDAVTQCRNRSNSIWLTYKDKTLTPKDWAYLINCPYRRFMKRLEQGWSMEKIMTTPIKRGYSNARLYN